MLGAVKRMYRKIQRARMMKHIAPYVRLSDDSFYIDGFNVDIRFPQAGHIYLETGSKSVIGCRCVFEKKVVSNSYVRGGGI